MNSISNRRYQRRSVRCGFSVIEVLIATSITSMLMTAVMFALNASFYSYQNTVESSSRDTIARLTMNAILTMTRTGQEFGPTPVNVITDPVIASDYVEFITVKGDYVRIEYDLDVETIYAIVDPDGSPQTEVLLTGVLPQYDEHDERILPFTMHYVVGPKLYRLTIDLLVGEDPGIDLGQEDHNVEPLRLISSVMPRNN